VLLTATLTALLAAPLAAQARPGPPDGLRELRRVHIVESDTLFLSRPTEIALGADGHVFVTEHPEARVLDIAPDGRIARVFGRKGRGPGEFMSPSTLVVAGDSTLFVFDRAQRILAGISLKTGKFSSAVRLMSGWPPAMRVAGTELLLTSFDLTGKTSLAVVAPDGKLVRPEGVLPDVGVKHPMLLQGGFGTATLAVTGDEVFAMFELSPSLYRWKRGTRSATVIPVPRLRRRGVDPSLFDRLLEDPNNTERVRSLIYNRSIPAALEFVDSGVLAVVTMDYTMGTDSSTTAFHVTVMNLNSGRACVDLSIPITRATMGIRDGVPRIAVRRDTLVVLEQTLDAAGESAPSLTWYRIEPARCDRRR
jgi:hypothetical protein